MISTLRSCWGALTHWRRKRLLHRYAVPDDLWHAVVSGYPFLALLPAAELRALRERVSLFLGSKEFTGVQGLVVTDTMAVAVAAQACLPILHLDLSAYDGFVGIVIHPDEVVAHRNEMDDDGVVHEFDEPLTGEAMQGGPVMLAWADVASAGVSAEEGYNVVIHEFAHVLDMQDGIADGVPLLATAEARKAWIMVLDRELEAFQRRVAADEYTGLDPYGAEGPEEFFAVASEAFFVAPVPLKQEHPDLYALLAGYYRQDPASRR